MSLLWSEADDMVFIIGFLLNKQTFSARYSLSLSWSWRSLVFFPTSTPPPPPPRSKLKIKNKIKNKKKVKFWTSRSTERRTNVSNLFDWTSSKICLRISKRSSSWDTKRKQTDVFKPRQREHHHCKGWGGKTSILQLVKTPMCGTFSVWSLCCSRARTWSFQLPIVINTDLSSINVKKRRVWYVFRSHLMLAWSKTKRFLMIVKMRPSTQEWTACSEVSQLLPVQSADCHSPAGYNLSPWSNPLHI